MNKAEPNEINPHQTTGNIYYTFWIDVSKIFIFLSKITSYTFRT